MHALAVSKSSASVATGSHFSVAKGTRIEHNATKYHEELLKLLKKDKDGNIYT